MPFIPNSLPNTFSDWIESEGLEDSFRPDPYRFESLTFHPVPENRHSTDGDSDSSDDDSNSNNDRDSTDDNSVSMDDGGSMDDGDSMDDSDSMDDGDDGESDEDNENEIDEDVIIRLLEREIAEPVPEDSVQSDQDSDDDSAQDAGNSQFKWQEVKQGVVRT